MTVTLHLRPDVEAGLLAQARANGMDLEDYLLRMVEIAAISSTNVGQGAGTTDRAEAVREMLAFGEKYKLSFGEPITRAALHEDHRF